MLFGKRRFVKFYDIIHSDLIMARVRIGTTGWLFDRWNEDYYPEDIPEDWKLGYYANDMTAVVVPEALWLQADELQLEDMVEDVHEEFAFYLQIESCWPSVEQQERIKIVLADHFFGFLVEDGALQHPVNNDNSDFIFPAAVFQGAGCSWSLLEQAGAQDCVLRITEESGLRHLKLQFEQLASVVDFSRDVLILIDIADPDPEFIRQLRGMLELMMIA